MTEVAQITASLKKALRARGVTYAQLAERLGLSEASVKRLFWRGSFTLERLERICEYLDLDFYELARMSRHDAEVIFEPSLEQERALVDDPRLLTVFYLLINDCTLEDICAGYVISEPEGIRLLIRLDQLKLIRLGINNKVKLLVSKNFNWRRGGPIRRRYEAQVISEFFDSTFVRHPDNVWFEARELSAASFAVMKRKLARLAREFADLAEIDVSLPEKEKQSIGLLLAIRPWVFSIVSALKRKR
ncbi:MAG: helix-turn-helix domain-containing protein [Gammaproteobacteria bacterium]